jgi:Cellulase (glycosyl hydrolase family 5)
MLTEINRPLPAARLALAGLALLFLGAACAPARAEKMERVRVAEEGRSFALERSGKGFTPWGFNYDHDDKGRLIEDYWESEWARVEEDFGEMRDLGANVVRVHLQLGKFLDAPDRPNGKALDRLGKLLPLAERTGLYLDLTGLGCYHKQDVPAWYDRLSERERWDVQARFWEAVARRCADSPAVFCYDLMNEPVVPGGKRKAGDWLGPPFAGKHFVQFITLDQAGRPRQEIARAWVKRLVAAVRKHDRKHLVTVGLVDWSLERKGLTSGFVPKHVAPELDFLCVHIYPKKGKVDEALDTLAGFNVGKPVVVEEMFPLQCSLAELEQFIDGSRKQGTAAGWLGFYWGRTPAELRRSGTIGDALTLGWLDLFRRKAKALAGRSISAREELQ